MTAPAAPVAAAAISGPPSALRLLAGFALGAVLGLVGVVLWVLGVALFKGFNISLFAIGVGWLAGFGVLKGCGRGGIVPAILGAVLALAATLLGSYVTTGGFGWFTWLCVAIGVYEGYIQPRRGT